MRWLRELVASLLQVLAAMLYYETSEMGSWFPAAEAAKRSAGEGGYLKRQMMW